MFQTEIKFITDFTLNHVKKLGAFFTFERLLETNIHPAIKQYLNAEFDYLIYEDRQKLIQGSLFDYSGSKINQHFAAIAEEIKKSKRVSFEDIRVLISRAVSFNVSYVLKPNWSLQKLIFADKKSVPVTEVELVLNYLYYFDYLKNVIKSYLTKRNITSLSSTEFELILNKIDRELFSIHFEKLVDNSLHSIADFFSIGGLSKRALSVEAVELFLKEKNLIDHLLKLKRTIPDPGKRKYEIDDIRRIIYSTAPVAPESVTPSEEATESEGDFEKVKTMEEAEIKSLTQTDEEPEDEKHSEEEIINDIVNDEIVKHDIEDLIQDEPEIEEIENESETEVPEQTETKEVIEPEKIKEDKSRFKRKKKKKDKSQQKEEESESETEKPKAIDKEPEEEEINNSTGEVEKDSAEEKEETQQDEQTAEEELKNEVEGGVDDFDDDASLLTDSEEEDLFAFYDEELKEIEELASDDEEEINMDELEENLNKQAEVEAEGTEEEPEKIEIEKDESHEVDDVETHPEKIEIEKDEADDELPDEPLKRKRDIFSFLNTKEINKITDSIFNSDSEDFANTIEKISECENYDQATEILKSLFISSKITPQSKPAVMLTDAVANYFDQV